ncbi:hypothetical protein [Nocardia sp. NPDC019395]|uniref:hypothetical protein n=1 Tax=Nocardia sp. NPDC019395 TaxID=3154686 RepID=UPI0033D39769
MRKSKFARAAALLSGLAVVGASAVGTAGTASASNDGGCGEFVHASYACVTLDDGVVNYSGFTDYTYGSGTVHLMLWDYTQEPGGVVVFTTDFPIATDGPHYYQPGGLADPSPGHDYKAEMRVRWDDGSENRYLSPDLIV